MNLRQGAFMVQVVTYHMHVNTVPAQVGWHLPPPRNFQVILPKFGPWKIKICNFL